LASSVILPFADKRFRVRRFINSEIVWSISLEQFPFRLQPIFEVIAEQPAVGAVDFVRAVQNVFDMQSFANCVPAKDRPLQFNAFREFVI
jgi:hypothetical protein